MFPWVGPYLWVEPFYAPAVAFGFRERALARSSKVVMVIPPMAFTTGDLKRKLRCVAPDLSPLRGSGGSQYVNSWSSWTAGHGMVVDPYVVSWTLPISYADSRGMLRDR